MTQCFCGKEMMAKESSDCCIYCGDCGVVFCEYFLETSDQRKSWNFIEKITVSKHQWHSTEEFARLMKLRSLR